MWSMKECSPPGGDLNKIIGGREMKNTSGLKSIKQRINQLEKLLDGLLNDAHYWDLRRTYGDYSIEVLQHLECCAEYQKIED